MARFIFLTLAFYILPYRFNRRPACTEQTEALTSEYFFPEFFSYLWILFFQQYFIIVLFQYTILGDREQVFPLYYKDFFEQICSDVQFISPPEEVGEFLLHLLNFNFLKRLPSDLTACEHHVRDT